MKKIKVAIIGAGSMGKEHARAFSAIPNVELCGVCSRTRVKAEKLAQLYNISVVCNSVDELYAKTKADLVVIAVPELQANSVAKIAFKYPWTILMEKPVGYDLSDAEDIFQYAESSNAEVLVGLNRRFYSSIQSILTHLKDNNENRYIHIQDQQSYEEARAHNHPEKVVEKFMYANSIHNIDLAFALARGEVSDVNHIKPWQGEQTEVMLTGIKFDSGDYVLYEGVWHGPAPWACSVSTQSKRFVMQPLETLTVQPAGSRKREPIEIDQVDKDYKTGFYRQAQEAVNYVLGKASQSVTLSEAMKTMRLIHAMFGV